jgi:ABC-2 type transport system ATP-binding protein
MQQTKDSTSFVFDLFNRFGAEIAELEVRRSSLEETYLSLLHRAESTQSDPGRIQTLEGAAR